MYQEVRLIAASTARVTVAAADLHIRGNKA
jgi:hypothetical protein